MSKPLPPYFGAAYYPEAWPMEQIPEDVGWMLKAGMNCMRVGEFAWSSMEPEEGEYRFEWLHTAVELLGESGIGTILGTPTATPPIWLVERYPEVLSVDDLGVRSGHGARRHVCPNNQVYRDYCGRIVARMAEEFGTDERVLGWQIDNEVYPPNGRSCSCPICLQLFRRCLRARFGTIGNLNAAWCLKLWSMEYGSFDQIPTPRRDIWHHPSLLAAWSEFASDSYAAYVKHQADILHAGATQPVGTDMMPFDGVDYHEMHRALDLVQFNHYNDTETLWRAGFWFDFVRPLKVAPFWNTETQTGWNGSVAINGGNKPRGWCRANSWLPFVLGGEANLYWLWRQHRAGQELMHGAVLASHGRPLYVFDEVAEIGTGLRAASDFLRSTRLDPTGLAVLWSQRVGRMAQWNPVMPGFHYQAAIQDRVYRPLIRAQWRPDVILPQTDLSAYRIIVCPFLFTFDEADLRKRLRAWIEQGGALIVGPLSDIRDGECSKFTHAPFGSLEEWASVRVAHSLPGIPDDAAITWSDGRAGRGSLWFDALEPAGAEVLATYADGPNRGWASVTRCPMGRGEVVMLGTALDSADLQRLVGDVAGRHGVVPAASASGNIVVAPRSGPSARGLVAVETEGLPGTLELTRAITDMVSGRRLSGTVQLEPYDVVAGAEEVTQ